MSGEVRKRKDKKKRKDDVADASFSSPSEDVNIHVYKEGGTGGNICAKIVFVLLFFVLIILVGLIIRENQDLNELENVEVKSRFSQIFEGWVEKSTSDEHDDDHSPENIHEYENEDDDDDHHYESDEQSLENSEEEQEDESQEYEEPEESVAESEEEPVESIERSEENIDDDDDDDDDSSDVKADVSDEKPLIINDDDDSSDMNADQSDENPINDDDDDDKGVHDDLREDKSVEDDESDEINTEAEASKENDGDIEPDEVKKPEAILEKERETTNEDSQPKQSAGLTTKIGVGLAILTVAYNVFLRKKPSDVDKQPVCDNEPTPNVSRRNTIIPPPTLQEIEADLPDLELEEEAYSDEEDYSDDDSHSEHRSVREEYEDLRETYSISLTPDGEFDAKPNYFEHENLPNEDDDEIVEKEELLGEEEEEIESEDDYDEDEDEKLVKRLDAKYGKLGRDINVGEESQSEGEDYEHSNITNEEDYIIKDELDNAQEQLKKNAAFANKLFEALVKRYPFSPRSLYGKAQALDILAEQNQRNDLLQKALEYYIKALELNNIPEYLYKIIGERYIDRTRFLGQYNKALVVHWKLIRKFPDNPIYLNILAVTYLTVNYVEEARSVLKQVLIRWPNDGFALVHYGFILKTTDNLLQESVNYMSRGLKTKAEGVIDGRFYFHLGDALSRLNKPEEALKVYEEGVKEKVFMSKYQRSLYNVPRLTGKPWWKTKDLPTYKKLFKALKDNWLKIRQEGLAALNSQGYFQDEAENLKDTGTWKQFELFARGRQSKKNCDKSPITCSIIQSFPDASSCKRGQTKFSVMHPKTHVWPHCGPTNCRLRLHLGLKIPPNTFIRVAEETRSWKEGDIIIFDDSFEHEVWHNGSDFRLVLIVDIWHPELTKSEKMSLSYI
ncbi:aspartyl beta-hydroxylase isoform X1 [Rhynchophorus ferrugineus]|uniref:aspartyl beta-hydroxylase isoform X1 n=1 Tax=Rhynchophorus ferrugineus TaxID=354439 RepID=UPI003FCDB791